MKNKIIVILLFIVGNIFSGETTSRKIGPGSIYYNFVDKNIPISVHILEFDLTNSNIEVITQKANSQLAALEKTSVMAQQLELENQNVIAAINADFFQKDGKPVGVQVADGVILKNPYARSVFGITENNLPFINILNFQAMLFTTNNKKCKIDGINANRQDDDLILFNNYKGISSNTNNWGIEISAQYISNPCVNDTSYLVVSAKDNSINTKGNKDIPGFGIILSAHGKKGDFLKKNISVGDTLKILLELQPIKDRIVEAIGGVPQIVRNSRIKINYQEENIPEIFCTTKHPRTAVGYNRKKTKLFMFVVDGRQSEYSVGMSLRELAKFMIDWGVHDGINLDGGGSSTMYVRGELLNQPSDATGERSVSNALVVLCKNKSNKIEYISLLPSRLKMKMEEVFQFKLKIFDKFYNPIEKDYAKWFCKKSLGSVNNNGEFTSSSSPSSGYIYIEIDGKKDSSYIKIE